MVLSDSAAGENLTPSLWMPIFSLDPHMGEGARDSVGSPL